jgi:hypothetical protein
VKSIAWRGVHTHPLAVMHEICAEMTGGRNETWRGIAIQVISVNAGCQFHDEFSS